MGNGKALALLNDVFGYAAFRGHQAEVIEHVGGGGDALVLMPTGSGKSLCYQIPALLREGVGVVVSPLIALMQDQVAALAELGVRAAFLNSTLSGAQAAEVEARVRRGELDLLYVAPERLLMPRCLDLLVASRLALIAIDEAHCVSQWGHDFRPEYLQLSVLQERFPAVPRIALTATADAQTRAEILQRLELGEARVFVSSFDRPNIRYRIVEKDDARRQLVDFIRAEHAGEAGIVYCLSRKKVQETEAGEAQKRIQASKLDAMLGLCETAECRRVRLLGYFGEAAAPCGNCDTCLDAPATFDGTLPAQQLLSCVYRTGQRFGAMHVIDVLRGEATDKVTQRSHGQLSTFGIGRERNEREWRAIARQCIALGLLAVDHDAYGALRLTAESRAVLKGERSIALRAWREAKRSARRSKAAAAMADLSLEASELFDRLRAWRLEAARQHGVPAYVIFHDATLREIARQRPSSLEMLRAISGIGARKLEAYGAEIIGLLR